MSSSKQAAFPVLEIPFSVRSLSGPSRVVDQVSPVVTIPRTPSDFAESAADVHALCRDEERVIERRGPCFPDFHRPEPAQEFQDLLASEASSSKRWQDAVMAD